MILKLIKKNTFLIISGKNADDRHFGNVEHPTKKVFFLVFSKKIKTDILLLIDIGLLQILQLKGLPLIRLAELNGQPLNLHLKQGILSYI